MRERTIIAITFAIIAIGTVLVFGPFRPAPPVAVQPGPSAAAAPIQRGHG